MQHGFLHGLRSIDISRFPLWSSSPVNGGADLDHTRAHTLQCIGSDAHDCFENEPHAAIHVAHLARVSLHRLFELVVRAQVSCKRVCLLLALALPLPKTYWEMLCANLARSNAPRGHDDEVERRVPHILLDVSHAITNGAELSCGKAAD